MKILNEKVELGLGNEFVSPRLVKESLEKTFKIRVVEERSSYIKLKIIRWARLYGFPFIWFQASIEIWLNRENDKIVYEFYWPEYWALIIPFALIPLIEKRVPEFVGFYILAFIFFGILIFLDTRWVARRVRKAFENK
jgi:hypothetical protein